MQYALVLFKKLFGARGLVAVLGVFIAGLTLLIILVPEEQPSKTLNAERQTINADELKTKLATLSTDSDNDGLKDWEEPLYKTDAQNPDTDGDGTNDGDEIKQNRDPLEKGPNDKITEPRKTAATETETVGPNLTAELMGTLIQGGVLEYLAQGGDPEALPDEFYSRIQAIAGDALEPRIPTVSLSELRVTNDSSEQAIKNYFNALAGVYEKYIFPLGKDDFVLFQEIIASEDIARFVELDPYINAVDATVAAMKKISVPQIRADFHKKEIEYVLKSRAQIAVMRNTDNDPLAAMIVIPQRIELKKEISEFHKKEMYEFLQARNIVFAPGEKANLILEIFQ